MDAPRPQRNRIHVDVYLPVDQAEARIAAALAAGACQYRAAEWRHKEVELAAHDLLQHLDGKRA